MGHIHATPYPWIRAYFFLIKIIIEFTFTVDKMYKIYCGYAHWGNKLARNCSRRNQAMRVLWDIILTKQEAFLF